MDVSSPGYSAAQALRTGGPQDVRQALVAARERTLSLAGCYAKSLAASGLRVPYRPTLNPPWWEGGQVGWCQEYGIARSRQRSSGIACDLGHERAASLLCNAD